MACPSEPSGTNTDMKLPLVVVGVALSTIVLSSCGSSSSEPAEQTKVAGNDASVVAQVDCGDDGVANVTVSYGSTKKETLVGRNEPTRSAGGVDTFSNSTAPGRHGDATLAVLTQPTGEHVRRRSPTTTAGTSSVSARQLEG